MGRRLTELRSIAVASAKAEALFGPQPMNYCNNKDSYEAVSTLKREAVLES
ncbi:hypothetical protein ACDZ28_18510 [Paenibacillus sp. RS8]|uniref:hypothetical protein n=1 Tax=Paenibacillus sp. RS8 TaxID=3242681 RepID=UPI0035BEE889